MGEPSLFAALNMATGEVIGTCMKKHRQQEGIRCLEQVKKSVPGRQQVQILCDNDATHKWPAPNGVKLRPVFRVNAPRDHPKVPLT